MFISDGGSTSDAASGKVFSGYAERSVKEMGVAATIASRNFYFTGLIKEKIIMHQANEDAWKNNRQKMRPAYADVLVDEVNELDPFLLVPMGELSFNFLTGHRNISKFRGSVMLPSDELKLKRKYKILPILGPQPYWNQNYMHRLVSEIDFKKIKELLDHAPPSEFKYNIWICTTLNDLLYFIKRRYDPDSYLYFDIETYGGQPTCISLCFGDDISTTGESICVPFLDTAIDRHERAAMLQQVVKLLASPIKKVNQNIKYDENRLAVAGIRTNNIVGDTMLAFHCLYSEMPKNLGFQTSIYTDIPYFKDEGKQTDPNGATKQRFYLYNAKDALAVSIIYPQQLNELNYFETRPIYENLIKLMPITRQMRDVGIRIDMDQLISLQSKYDSLLAIELYKLMKLINRGTDRRINVNSPAQVHDLVFEELGYTKVPGVKGTDEKSLYVLMAFGEAKKAGGRLARDILQSVLDCRKLFKVMSFLSSPLHPDGRFRYDTNLAGTETGRTSGGKTSDPFLYFDEKYKIEEMYLGHNGQNIGKHGFEIDGIHLGIDLRRIFISDFGYSFVSFDLKSAEARVDTIYAADYDILPVFDSPTGIHRLTGSWIYNCDPSEIKKNVLIPNAQGFPEERYHTSKQVRHAAERNMFEYMLMMLVRLPLPRCKEILGIIHSKQPKIREVFHHQVREEVRKERRLVAPNGRHRIFMGKLGKNLENEAISTLPQAVVGDQTKFSMIPIKEQMPWALPLVEAHDGVLYMVPTTRVEEFKERATPLIETVIDFRQGSLKRDYQLVIPTEWEKGNCWYGMEEF